MSRLVLVEPAGLQSEEERLADPKVAAAYVRGGRAFEQPTAAAVRDRLHGLVVDPSKIDEELVETRYLLYASDAARAVHQAVRRADNRAWLLSDDVLARIPVATLLIHGELATTPLGVVERAARAACAEVVTVAGTKQWPQLEQPELVNRLLLAHAHTERKEVALT